MLKILILPSVLLIASCSVARGDAGQSERLPVRFNNLVTINARSQPLHELLHDISKQTNRVIDCDWTLRNVPVTLTATRVNWRLVLEFLGAQAQFDLTYPADHSVRLLPWKRFSMSLRDANIRNALELIADLGGPQIVHGPRVQGRFSIQLTDVNWRQALQRLSEGELEPNKWLYAQEVRGSRRVWQVHSYVRSPAPIQQNRIFLLRHAHTRRTWVNGMSLLRALHPVLERDGKLVPDPSATLNAEVATRMIYCKATGAVLKRISRIVQMIDFEARLVRIGGQTRVMIGGVSHTPGARVVVSGKRLRIESIHKRRVTFSHGGLEFTRKLD